jgi:hypothetical protein
MERWARHAPFHRLALLIPFRCTLFAWASSWGASDLVHVGNHRLYPHFAHWSVRNLINTDRRSHMRGAGGDFRDVVKIAQTFLHRPANLSPTVSKVELLNCNAVGRPEPSPVGSFFRGDRR